MEIGFNVDQSVSNRLHAKLTIDTHEGVLELSMDDVDEKDVASGTVGKDHANFHLRLIPPKRSPKLLGVGVLRLSDGSFTRDGIRAALYWSYWAGAPQLTKPASPTPI